MTGSAGADPLARITILLVSPLHAGNVGACARAVKNMGLGGMALVEPVPTRDPEAFRQESRKLAVDATDVIDALRIGATLDDVITPATYLVATTAKQRRGLALQPPREVGEKLIGIARDRPVAILFGREDHGLPDRLVARAQVGVQVPSSGAYPVLNLSQTVMLVAYELRLASQTGLAALTVTPRPPPAELDALQTDALRALETIDFLKPHNRDRVFAELADLLARAAPSAREVTMLRGICSQIEWLAGRKSGA